jgi:hypothetical protein
MKLMDSNNFYSKLTHKYDNYKIPVKKKSFDDTCFPKSYELQQSQKFISHYIHPSTNNKSILIFWQIGSGKTCGAIRIAEEWVGKRKIILVVPASLKGNIVSELRSPCAGNEYLTSTERNKLQTLNPFDKEYIEIINKSDERISKHYNIYSYNKFIELINDNKISFHNSILIIDEIQNMISQHGKYYESLYSMVKKSPSDLRIVLMSATPMFDKPIEIGLVMNLLKIPNPFPIDNKFNDLFTEVCKNKNITSVCSKNLELFKKNIKGYVSYYRGAPPYTFPEKKIKYVKCEMSDFQYRSYLTVLKNENNIDKQEFKVFLNGEIKNLPNNFFIGTRIISNVAFPNRDIGIDGFEAFKGKSITTNLEMYSIKFFKILKKINNCNGTIFIYSSFKEYGGIKSLARVLDNNGYQNYNDYGIGKKRYGIWSGDVKLNDRETMKDIFNSINNKNGSKIKIILGTPAIKDGVSLYNVQQVHILEPLWNISRLEQIIGRAVRYCSHKNMDPEMRFVKIYIYLATHPDTKITVDEYITLLAKQKYDLIKDFELALKESAIDCELFKNANVYKGEANIICEK